MYEVTLNKNANEDIEGIFNYISRNLFAYNAAKKIILKIKSSTELLKRYPYACTEIITKPHKIKYRRLISGKYIILYQINETKKQCIIHRVIYGRSNYTY